MVTQRQFQIQSLLQKVQNFQIKSEAQPKVSLVGSINCIIFFILFLVAKDFSQYEPIFLQMSEDKKTVNAFELADLLEACLPNGTFSKINEQTLFQVSFDPDV